MIAEPSFTVGIEEEYLLVDRETRDLVEEPPGDMLAECEALLEGQVAPEFLRAQIEVGTRVCGSMAEARADLSHLRRTVAAVAGRYGAAPIAVSTHPFAEWRRQKHTDKARYNELAEDMQVTARRLLICGMHVHVGVPDDELRIDLMGQVGYFLPHLLVLSTSSPFWRGEDTGLLSYRLNVFDEVPRTGLPERFDSWAEYRRHLEVLIGAGLLEDGSKIWWDVRPSERFPTLEMRITDVCTRVDDTVTIAALYACLIAMLTRLRRSNRRWRAYSNMLVNENRWRAQRYGFSEGLVDFGRGEIVPYADLIEEILELVGEEADRFGCRRQVEGARDILARGTSAHGQLDVYRRAVAAGADPQEAIRAVVDWLIEHSLPDAGDQG